MAEQTYQITKVGASMDYDEHHSTYSLFILLVKWGIILNIALLAGMSIGFFTPLGLFGGIISFCVIAAAPKFFSR